jgi:hypothetical protein
MGAIVQQEIEVTYFDKIILHTGIELIIKESAIQSVIIETGKNKLDNVYVNVLDDVLELEADDRCLLSASLDPVKVIVCSPNIKSIRNSSEFGVYSDGVLGFPVLSLLTENHDNEYLNIGNFYLQINNQSLKVVSNGISNVSVSGITENLDVLYYGSIGRFEGKDLIARNVHFHHRAENTLQVNPQESLKGDLYSIGDVISYNHPPLVEVIEHYEGQLIFDD